MPDPAESPASPDEGAPGDFEVHAQPAVMLLVALAAFQYVAVNGEDQILGAVWFTLGIAFVIVVHEAGHAAVARLFGAQKITVEFTVLGGNVTAENYRIERWWRPAVVAAAGPVANAAGALILMATPVVALRLAGAIGMVLAFGNLVIPIEPLDGQRVVSTFTHHYATDPNHADRVARRAWYALLVCGWAAVVVRWNRPVGGALLIASFFTLVVVCYQKWLGPPIPDTPADA